MKYNFLLILTLCFSFFFLCFEGIAQKKWSFPLSKSKAQGSTWVLGEKRFFYPKKKPKIPLIISNHRFFLFDINPTQGLADRVYNNEMTHEDSLYSNDSNLENYSRKKLNHEIIFLSGRSMDNRTHIIIPDRNFNMDFSDDTILKFDLSKKTFHNEVSDNYEGAEITLNYDVFNFGEVEKRDVSVTIYHHNPRYANIYSNPKDKDYIMFVTNNEQRKTDAIIKNNCYTFYISPIYNFDDYSQNFLYKTDTCNKSSDMEFGWRFKDSLVDIENTVFQSSVTKLGDTLTLTQMDNKVSKNIPDKETMSKIFSLKKENIHDDTSFSLRDIKNKYILLNFWGTWCQPCLAEMPQIDTLYKNLDSNKIKLIGVACDNSLAKVKNYLSLKSYYWNQVFEDINPQQTSNWSFLFRITQYPHWILINPQGEIELKQYIDFPKLLDILKQKKVFKN